MKTKTQGLITGMVRFPPPRSGDPVPNASVGKNSHPVPLSLLRWDRLGQVFRAASAAPEGKKFGLSLPPYQTVLE